MASTKFIRLLAVLWLAFAAAACRGGQEVAPTSTVPPEATQPPQATATVPATPTEVPGRVIMLASELADASQTAAIRTVLEALALEAGYTFEVRTALAPGEITPELHLVVAVTPDPGLAQLAASAPNVQFLGIGIAGLQPAANLSLLAEQGERADRKGFLAGYVAAIVTADWRVGVISRNDTVPGKSAALAFRNGVIYFCGLCRPATPPFVEYPLMLTLPNPATEAEAAAVAENFLANGVKSVYVFSGAGDEMLLRALAQKEMRLIGEITPPAGLEGNWIATVQTDWGSGLRNWWAAWQEGRLAQEALSAGEAPIDFANVNEALFSPGRQNLVREMLNDLVNDRIDTGVNLQTGDAR